MKAKEMFEESKFKLKVTEDDLIYTKNRKANAICDKAHYFSEIRFDITFKNITFESWYILNNMKHYNFTEISIKEHKAIHEQMKELGWLE